MTYWKPLPTISSPTPCAKSAKTDIGFTNGFRFGVPVPPEAVTEADLWNLLPMDARMKRGWVTGKELRDYLENELEMVYAKTPLKLNGGWGPRASGMTIVFDARAEYGHRVVSIKINGRDAEDGWALHDRRDANAKANRWT